MRIILSNKFYYRRGGDCIYMLNLEQLLRSRGHEVAVFAMDYPENMPTEWSKYFPSEVRFRPGRGMAEAFCRPFGTAEVKRKFAALLDDFKPDVLHVNNIHSQLSPLIVEMAHERGVRTVWTLHDHKLVCPRYDCLQNGMTLCHDCAKSKTAVLRHRCMKNSAIASVLAYLEAAKWTRERLERVTDAFICPSRFMRDSMLQGGFGEDKLHVLCNFIDVNKCRLDAPAEPGDYYCYVGRLSAEKGLKTLCEAAARLPHKLVLIGDGPLGDELRASYAGGRIEFAGYRDWEYIRRTVAGARMLVLPSECYENNPLSVIEAQCLGAPVLGARIGGIPELIDEGRNGATFASGDADDLRTKIERMWASAYDRDAIATAARAAYGDERYYERLIELYK